jgi:Flp pilus assembly protein TadB
MRWLLIALFVSLAGLLIAAAGMVFHVWMHRARNRSEISANAEEAIDSSRRPAEKAKAKAKK